MPIRHIIVVGASGGGIEALRALVNGLPGDFPAPICVVLHTSPEAPGILADILTRVGRLQATNAVNGESLKPGHIYVAPPDFHLIVEPGKARVTKGPRENRFRPAIDPLFRSAAQVFGPAAIGVLLTGSLDDGTAGLWAIKQLGGTTIVQDPADALYSSMPQNAIEHVKVDHVVPLARVASLLVELTSVPAPDEGPVAVPEQMHVEVKIAMEHNPVDAGLERIGEPSSFACPECHGVLLQLKEGTRTRFRCHTGHAYSVQSLLAAIGDSIEEAMWIAVRALEEGQLLMGRMAEHVRGHDAAEANQLCERADEARRQSEVIRQLLIDRDPLPAETKEKGRPTGSTP